MSIVLIHHRGQFSNVKPHSKSITYRQRPGEYYQTRFDCTFYGAPSVGFVPEQYHCREGTVTLCSVAAEQLSFEG